MAKNNAVWGIDIGQCALKALRCTMDSDGETVVADKYDYIEYPKILSQPEADPEELIREALEQFLSRNTVLGDSVAISVSGQAGLSRFFKPPPVELKKLPSIVEYEVKQQIPFPIEDVIWDWQQLGGTVVEGRTIDAEVGLFAMKRDAVIRALRPFDEADVEVDYVQLSPLSIFNVVCHDIIEELPDPEAFDPENPPESLVVMSMGTETTDLIVSNGIKLWLRNIPIGGNHFTKQLSRELKLTQAKAEHLKRNARASENPKAVFKAMRPVFNDLVNEVQRSLTFFQSMDKTAEISKFVLLGNAAKLPGLRQYLNKQLEIDIAKVSDFKNLKGSEVVSQKTFSDNLLAFAPCYGLCLQGLKRGQLKTNLLPQEMVVERIIRAKKPWVLASLGALMLGCMMGYFFKGNAWWAVNNDFKKDGVSWKDAKSQIDQQASTSSRYVSEDDKQTAKLANLKKIAQELVSASEDKTSWIEIQSAIAQALPKDQRLLDAAAANNGKVSPSQVPFEDRKELYIDHIETVFKENLMDEWYVGVKSIHENMFKTDIDSIRQQQLELKKTADAKAAEAGAELKEQKGWVIEIKGHHFHNSIKAMNETQMGKEFLINNFLRKLMGDRDKSSLVSLPDDERPYQFSDFGIYYPTITRESPTTITRVINLAEESEVADGAAQGGDREGYGGDRGGESRGGEGRGRGQGGDEEPEEVVVNENQQKVREYTFTIQMAWIPRNKEERMAAREEREKKEAEAAAKATPADGKTPPPAAAPAKTPPVAEDPAKPADAAAATADPANPNPANPNPANPNPDPAPNAAPADNPDPNGANPNGAKPDPNGAAPGDAAPAATADGNQN